ncbi:hypothetical protein K2173_011242 [Erythroxylum novogranatense]|uniref:Transmembrane protein n=1 Tax=Erythroxylum novogranatense TaxID=1862640 RepID=A0AAV8TTA9_9ROSI|nr:hypothetical protein K2173_011242 [Erythroxylum novogranatense]
MMFCGELKDRIHSWIRDYDRLQFLALILLYIQIGCALIGSLGALYNGVLVINLGIALFALVAIESSSQTLGRTYAVLLFCSILLDIAWFILFSRNIWELSSKTYGAFFIFSVKLTLAMQIIGFSVRLSSSFLWVQIYRLGVSHVETTQFLSPVTPAVAGRFSDSDVVVGGSVYDPDYYSSLFEDGQNTGCLRSKLSDKTPAMVDNVSSSAACTSQLKVPTVRTSQTVDEENADPKLQIV